MVETLAAVRRADAVGLEKSRAAAGRAAVGEKEQGGGGESASVVDLSMN